MTPAERSVYLPDDPCEELLRKVRALAFGGDAPAVAMSRLRDLLTDAYDVRAASDDGD